MKNNPLKKALHKKGASKTEEISGQCENCGGEYKMQHTMKGEPKCPHCKKETMNWDTTHGSTMSWIKRD